MVSPWLLVLVSLVFRSTRVAGFDIKLLLPPAISFRLPMKNRDGVVVVLLLLLLEVENGDDPLDRFLSLSLMLDREPIISFNRVLCRMVVGDDDADVDNDVEFKS